jgi:uncharacterized DUF497 family protein
MALTFEWDAEKAARNVAKHGVSFDEAASVFADPLGRVVADPRHSIGEERSVLLGHSHRQRLLAVLFTERGESIRVISARLATRHEQRAYEEGSR